MITVSNDYKTMAKGDVKQYLAFVESDTDKIEEIDDLVSVKMYANGDIGRAVIKKAEFSYKGSYDFLGKDVNIQIGLVLTYDIYGQPATWEYIDYGDFKVDKIEYNPDAELTTATCYDKMYEALVAYSPVNVTYPCTLADFVGALCTAKGWTLGTLTFTNDDITLDGDPFVFQDLTDRVVLEKIAEATGTVIYFDASGELILRDLNDTGVDTLTISELKKMGLRGQWGGLNSVKAGFPPYGDAIFKGGYRYDNILTQDNFKLLFQDLEEIGLQEQIEITQFTYDDYPLEDDTELLLEGGLSLGQESGVATGGLVQYVFDNNQLATQAVVDGIFARLEGFAYYPHELDTIGLGWYEVGDRITITDKNSVDYATNILNIDIELTESGYKEKLYTPVWENSNTAKDQNARTVSKTVKSVAISGEALQDNTVDAVKIRSLTADKISTGTLAVDTTILINDGTTDRILIGYQAGGF